MKALQVGFTHWPDGELREAPADQYTYVSGSFTFTWDGELESWVDNYGGNLISFTPKESKKQAAKCDCGGQVTGGAHFHWCSTNEEVL